MRMCSGVKVCALTALWAGTANAGVVETREFAFPRANMSTFGAIFEGDPWIGSEIIEASINFRVEVTSGSAADLSVIVDLPITPDAGNVSFVLINGADLGWSGTGIFEYTQVTDMLNGVGRVGSYGAEFPTPDFSARLLEGSGITLSYIPVPAPASLGLFALPALATRRRR